MLGDHQASVLVYGERRALADHMFRVCALLADSGLVVAREDPGAGSSLLGPRPAAITAATSRA